jgi:very-short-patch-repair endonuclease
MTTPALRPTEPSPTSPLISPERVATVDAARSVWIRKLIDLSRRNNLLFYRPLKTGMLDLSTANVAKMAELLSGQSVPASRLLGETWKPEHNDLIRDIGRRALANLEERGLSTLFVVLGMATWGINAWPGDSGRPVEAPVLMLPVKLESTAGRQSFSLIRTGAPQVNLVLLHVLETQFGVKSTSDDLIPHLLGDDEGEAFDPQPLYQQLILHAPNVPGFAVRPCAVLGNFAFQKMAMVKDLQEHAAGMAAHDVVSAIAGDKLARAQVAASQHDLDPHELDHVPPQNEFLVLDADSSQQCAISGVLSGESAVVHGPPGTGKSQTITNLIAGLAAEGKRVLFVAEKRAALEVVLRRLQDSGLDHLTIDLHGADVSPRKVMEQVARTLDTIRNSTPVNGDDIHKRLQERRERLNAHVRRMHERLQPAGKSAYELQGLLLRLPHDAQSSTRWRGSDLQKFNPALAQQIRDLFAEAGGMAALFLRTDASPWTGAKLPNGTAVQRALELSQTLATKSWKDGIDALNEGVSQAKLKPPANLTEARVVIELLDRVHNTLEIYAETTFSQDVVTFLRQLSPGKHGGFAALWASLSNGEYRQAKNSVLEHRSKGKISVPELYRELETIAAELTDWSSLAEGSSKPAKSANWPALSSRFHALDGNVAELEKFLDRPLAKLPLAELGILIESLFADSRTPHVLPKLYSIENKLDQYGVTPLVEEIRKTRPPVEYWPLVFDYASYASTLDAACAADHELLGFQGSTHSKFVEEFRHFDEERIELAAARVRRKHAERAIDAMNRYPDQQFLLRAEAEKSRRHLPLRKLFAQASDVLTAVSPCWMASPLSVSQLLDGSRRYFDVVIFDEASQVLPEDAVPSVLRGDRLVVAGDSQQLPPTTFFASGEDESLFNEEDPQATEGFESLLDMMNSFLRSRYLEWHYRSRDEALISFSNHHVYKDRLVTFPGPGGLAAISHVLVQQALGQDGEEESSAAEVRRVVELILEHARTRPQETLGVIAMGIKHADRLQRALDEALGDSREFDEFFDTSRPERFFIKNLERVQGDERDAIILSIGYGKDRAGNLPFRFGPLLSAGGRRRLNVAITRARQRLTLVSSFSHLDMDLARVKPGSGVELLRNYLQYAATNGQRLGDANVTGFPENSFEAEVEDVLSARGMKLIPQMGSSSYRIDLVAEHPSKPGRYVLAIECDGASYHSSYTARDRDRLREQQLERLGWRFHRIWSTDWFMRKQAEVERALAAFESAVKYADQLDSGLIANGHNDDTTTNSHLAGGTLVERRPRPQIAIRTNITQYPLSDIISLIRWIGSDGQLRTDDQIITELVPMLGFARRGARIDAVLKRAIAAAKQ